MVELHPAQNHSDLVDAVRSILHRSDEPLTISRIHERLPALFRAMAIEELTEILKRQVAADVFIICPKYRSSQDRYWDRPLREHARTLLREALSAGPASWSDLRKKLPKYVRYFAESILSEELAKGAMFRHPPLTPRMGPRFGLQPAEPRYYAKRLLLESLNRLQQLGFSRAEGREALSQLLQEEEWAEAARQTTQAAASPMPVWSELFAKPVF